MMDLTTFDFEGVPARFVEVDGRTAMVGVDAARCLEIANHRNAFARIPNDEKGVHTVDTLGGPQEMVVLYEPGIYRMIFESRKAAAERLKTWVFNTVLPEIRRTGRFGGAGAKSELDSVLALARSCELVRRIHGRPAAQRLWSEMGGMPLPIDDDGVTKRYPSATKATGGKGLRNTGTPSSSRPVSPAKAATDARSLRIVQDFIRECCVRSSTSAVQALPLYQAYDAWDLRRGRRAMSQTRFGRTMRLAGIQKGKPREIFYYGLRLKPGAAARAS